MPPWAEFIGEWVLGLLIPPKLDIDEKSKASFRRWSIAITAICVASLVQLAWAFGLLPWTSGPAQASSVDAIKRDFSVSVDGVKKEIITFKNTQKLSDMRAEMRRTDQAIFDVQSRINEQKSRGKDADGFYLQRLQDLTSHKDEVARSLNSFARLYPELVADAP